MGLAVRIRRFHSTTIPQPPTTNKPPTPTTTQPQANHNHVIARQMCCDLAGEARGGRGRKAVCWNSCGSIGRKCAFYNGFAGPVPTKSESRQGDAARAWRFQRERIVQARRIWIWREDMVVATALGRIHHATDRGAFVGFSRDAPPPMWAFLPPLSLPVIPLQNLLSSPRQLAFPF